jgi:diguanylate cyclase (GGDEF)-like protein
MIKAVMMTPDERILLERNELFRDIDLVSIDHILSDCLVVAVCSGEKLLEIGQRNNSLYLVLEGELHVYLDSRDLTEHAVLGAGQCAGELSLIDGGNASALVIAARDTRVLAVPHDHVWSLVDNSHGVARNLLCILAGRIRNDNLLRVTTDERRLEFEVAANVDALTGLHNRSWMDDAFPRMMLRCERGQAPLCMLIADIDHFENFSHTHGRSASDGVLKALAKLLAENLRPQDLLVYLGGDKFAVLLPETSSELAVRIAERLCEAMAMVTLHTGASDAIRAAKSPLLNQDTRVTISVGIAPMRPGDTLDSIFSMTHMALYQAKAAGRNQVKVAAVPA